jgi:tRNA A37 threonylcarbamoyltransferase TsaD
MQISHATEISGPVLGIESSCDETAAAVLAPDGRVLAEAVLSQETEHAPYGGVVPEIAARAHLAHSASSPKVSRSPEACDTSR